MSSVIAETARLVLEDWTDHDVEPLAALGTADVVRFLGGEPWTASTARESMQRWRQIEERLGLTTWAVRLRENGQLIGTCGFAGTNVPWLRVDVVVEIGWTLGRAWWGRGLATEAAVGALAVGLARYSRERIVSKCHIDNVASERVMHRIGMSRVGVVRGAWPAATVVCRLA